MATFDVLMPVRNGMPYLPGAIDSIRSQTLSDWRLFVLDHESTDGSLALARRYAEADRRIVVLPVPASLSFSELLNTGLELCDARYVLRQDADDISLPQRMRALADAFAAEPATVLLGSCGDVIDGSGRTTGRFDMPLSPRAIAAAALFRIPVLHPAAALRLDALAARGAHYGQDFIGTVAPAERLVVPALAEDYFLFGQLALTASCRNLSERLIRYRWHDRNVSVTKQSEQQALAVTISRYLARSYALLLDLPGFDPAPFCNHGYRLVECQGHGDPRHEFALLRETLGLGQGWSPELRRELGFRACLVTRSPAALLPAYLGHVARHGIQRAEWYTVKSWLRRRLVAGRRGAATDTLAVGE